MTVPSFTGGRTKGSWDDRRALSTVNDRRQRPRSCEDRSAAALVGGARRHLGAGVGEDALEAATEGEDDDDDQGGDAGDQKAVLDGRGAALVHLGEAAVQHDSEVVEHGGYLLDWVPRAGAGA